MTPPIDDRAVRSTDPDRRAFLQSGVAAAGAVALVGLLGERAFGAQPAGSRKLKVAVAGIGRQGRLLLAQLQRLDHAEVVALCDVNDRRLAGGVRRVPGVEGFASLDELLSKRRDVEAVVIATPTHTHRALAELVLGAGKHVYCEAPLASTLEDARAIAAAARGASGVFMTGLCARSNPVYQLARTFFRSDAVRNPVLARAQHHRKGSLRVPASNPADERAMNWLVDPAVSLGLPGEWGVHQFDVAHWYLERYPVAVWGHGSVRAGGEQLEIPDTVVCTLLFEDGLAMQYSATSGNTYETRYEVLAGTNAAIKLAWSHGWMFKEADAPTQGWEVYANRQQFHNDEGITLIADATKLASQGKLKEGVGLPYDPEYYALADFLKSVIDGTPVVTSAEEGLRATAVAVRAAEAVRRQSLVTISPDDLRGV